MNRRIFNKTLSILGGATLLNFPAGKKVTGNSYPLGYQLFSIRDEMAKDPIATLNALIAMGYQDFELYGYDEQEDQFYGMVSDTFAKVINDLGITITSGHYGFAPYLNRSDEALKVYVDKCIKAAKTINSKYITWPWIDENQRTIDNFKIMAEKLNLIGEQVTNAGLGFAYHNHGFEFEEHNGETGFDIILKDTDPELVKLEMDMYWVMHSAKFTPKELVAQQPGRIKLWHIKDMDKITQDYTELGNGSIDYHEVLPDPNASGLDYFYIEQGGNFTLNSTESARFSAQYFEKELRQYLK